MIYINKTCIRINLNILAHDFIVYKDLKNPAYTMWQDPLKRSLIIASFDEY